MKVVEHYECEICGEVFENNEKIKAEEHERAHFKEMGNYIQEVTTMCEIFRNNDKCKDCPAHRKGKIEQNGSFCEIFEPFEWRYKGEHYGKESYKKQHI